MPKRQPPVSSPLLPLETLETRLIDQLGEIGAASGGIGGAAGGGFAGGGLAGAAGAAGGASGGRAGARWGSRKLTKTDGAALTLPVPRVDAAIETVRREFFKAPIDERFAVPPGGLAPCLLMVGLVGSGTWNMNPCVMQLIWSERELYATAHAREGLIKQKTCAKALNRLATVLGQPGIQP